MPKHTYRGKQITITATVLGVTSLSCVTSWPNAPANPVEWQESHLCSESWATVENSAICNASSSSVLRGDDVHLLWGQHRDGIPGRVQGRTGRIVTLSLALGWGIRLTLLLGFCLWCLLPLMPVVLVLLILGKLISYVEKTYLCKRVCNERWL